MKNYFEHFGIPVAFNIDEVTLKRSFLEKSRSYHPDFHTLSDSDNQADMLELSSYNNEAYKTLKSFKKRYRYILELNGAVLDEGQQKLPQSFLMEMMDFNERLMDAQMEMEASQISELKAELESLKSDQFKEIETIIENYNHEKVSDEEKQKLLDHYLKDKYLLRIQENLDKFAAQ